MIDSADFSHPGVVLDEISNRNKLTLAGLVLFLFFNSGATASE